MMIEFEGDNTIAMDFASIVLVCSSDAAPRWELRASDDFPQGLREQIEALLRQTPVPA